MLSVDDILVPMLHIGDLIKIKSAHNPYIDINCQYFVLQANGTIVTIARRVVDSFKPEAMKRDSETYTIDTARDRFQRLDFKVTPPDNTCIGVRSCVRITFPTGEICPGIVTSCNYEVQKSVTIKVGCDSQMLETYIDTDTINKEIKLSLESDSKIELISLQEYEEENKEPLYKEVTYKDSGVIKHAQIVGWTCFGIKKVYYIINDENELVTVYAKNLKLQSGQQLSSNEYAGMNIKNVINADILNFYSQKPSKYKYPNFEDMYEYNLKEILQMTGHSGDLIDESSYVYDIPSDQEMLNKYSTAIFKEFCKLNNIQYTPKLLQDKFLSALYEQIKDIVWQYLPEQSELTNWCSHSYY